VCGGHGGNLLEPEKIHQGGFSLVKYHVGVDVGKDRHRVCIRDLAKGVYCRNFPITNDRDGFTALITVLEKLSSDKSDFLIGVEACFYALNLSYFLLAMGFTLVEINPFRANQFRKAQGKKAKTDKIDAHTISAILSINNHKPLLMPDPILDNLKELTRFRVDLINERATMIIHLQEALSVLFPEYQKVFRQLDSAGSLALLATYPGPEHMIGAGEEAVGKTLSLASPRRMSRGMARRIIEAATRTVGVVQRQPSLGIKISVLAKRIASLQSTIQDLDRQITALFNSVPCRPQGFPVGRAPSLATLIAEIGDIHQYPTLKKFLSHLGWCPQSFQTGSYNLKHPKMSHAGNKYIRRIIWMLSIFAVQFVPRYREYFQRRVSEGKAKMHIIVAVGRKLLSALYAMLKTGMAYDPNWEVNGRLALARR